MKITILGSGTCVSDLEGIEDRFPPGFWVKWNGGHLLLDLGEGIRFRLGEIGVKYPTVQHIAISHAHADHYTLPQFLQAMYAHVLFGGIKSEKLSLYAPDTIVEQWPALFRMYVPEAPAPDVHCYEGAYLWPKLRWTKMSSTHEASIGNAVLRSERVYHGLGRCDALAFRLEAEGKALTYSGDTGDCEGIRSIARAADLFICEASGKVGGFEFAKRYGHLTPYQAGEIAEASGVKKLVLTHHSGVNSNEEMVSDCRAGGFHGELVIAKDFDVLEV